MKCFVVLSVILAASAMAFPAENLSGSARIDLGIGGVINKQASFNSAIANPKLSIIQQKSGALAQLIPIPERPRGREEAAFEIPSIIQQKDSIYDKAQQIAINFLHPRPIVDTISEDEKYGNSGDQFRPIGDAIVGGFEGFSNFINAAVDLPFEAMKQLTRKATTYVSTIGAKLVGL